MRNLDPALLLNITEAIADGLLVVDEDQTIAHVNGRMEALFGYSRDELIGQTVELLIPAPLRPLHSGQVAAYLRDPITREMGGDLLLTGRRKDGSELPVEIGLSAAAAGGRRLVVAVVRDVTERHRIQTERREEQERHRLFAEHARDIVYHIRLQPSPLAAEYVSPAVLPLTGYSPQELIEQPDLILRMVHPDDRPGFERLLHDPAAAMSPRMLRIVRRDGTIAWHEESMAHILDAHGIPIAIERIARDVTDRMEVERERQLLGIEAERQRDRERIALDLHDGVMQTIYGVGLNLQNAATQLTTDPAQARSTLDDATTRLRQTIDDLRRYVMGIRPQSRQIEFPAFVETLANDLRAQTTLSVSVTLPTTVPALRPEQSLAIFHVLREALSNIQRHARAREASITVASEDGSLYIVVRDDGQGFDASAALSGEHMGLRSMRVRARAIGGDLTILSKPGSGAVVHLALPL